MIIDPGMDAYARRVARRQQMLHWWRMKVKTIETPFFACAAVQLSPVTVDETKKFGPHFSAGFEPGIRTFCFTTQSDRDRFLTYYRRGYGAKPCGNPHK